MTTIGTALTETATKIMLLGSGELGKELTFELQGLGIEVIAVDRYANAPAQQVAHKAYTINMLDASALRTLILAEKPDYIIPEVEAIATDVLIELEKEGFNIVPMAKAVLTTMNRAAIRELASKQLKLPTSDYFLVNSKEELINAVNKIGVPCVIKPIMSSSGRGQSLLKDISQIDQAWASAHAEGRTQSQQLIVEAFIDFDYEITLLTVRHKDGISFAEPIGHTQKNGDYNLSWQPCVMSKQALTNAKEMAVTITNALGGYGLFGVELFIKGDNVIFNEIAPRPHDTGLVTLVSQELSEFALHIRAILGLPVPKAINCQPSASKPIVVQGNSKTISFSNMEKILAIPDVKIRLFGKGEISGHRRLGVMLATGANIDVAINKVDQAYNILEIKLK